jgi:TonB family protein
VYEVGSQFRVTITKEALNNAISLRDLVPNEVTEGISSFRDVNIAIGSPYQNTAVKSSDERLNSDQIKLLKSLNYSTNFRIEAFSSSKNLFTGILEEKCFVYYVTVIPEKEASYKLGNEALLTYLRAKSSKVTANIEKDQMQSAKLRFKVTKNGTITNLKLKGTSGYSEVDRKMFELIMNMSGKWNPAETANGKKVAQELVFSFGSVGC